MDENLIPTEDAELDRLEAYLESDRSPPECMTLSALDGYLTALAIGPERIPSSEWMPVIWGEGEPVFTDDAEKAAILAAIESLQGQIIEDLQDETPTPILWIDENDLVVAVDWAEGFMLAVELRSDAWLPLFESRRYAESLLPILGLCSDENGESALGLSQEEDDEILEKAPDLLPGCILEIAEFWRRRESAETSKTTAPKAGRNDLCPCGSGKKFKKCCGA